MKLHESEKIIIDILDQLLKDQGMTKNDMVPYLLFSMESMMILCKYINPKYVYELLGDDKVNDRVTAITLCGKLFEAIENTHPTR